MAPSFRIQIVAALAGLLVIGALLLRATVTGPPASAPAPGGTFVEGVVGTPRQINPLLAGTQAERDLAALIFAGLTRLGADGKPAPDLAATWQISPDERRYTFFLRQDARWSDGEPVTADDVLFTVSLLQNPTFPGDPALVGLWRALTVTKLDRFSVRFDLTQPYSPFLQYTTLGLLPAHLLRHLDPARVAEAAYNAAPVGAGRWCMAPCLKAARLTPGAAAAPTSEAGRGLVLEPNPHAGPPPLLRRLWFRFYPTPGALLTAFDQGEVDGLGSVEPAAVAGLRARPDLRLYEAELPATEWILLNLRLPLFDRRETRQALVRGLDRAALVRHALHGQAQPADSPLLPSSWAHRPVLDRYAPDPAAAAQLLDAAGWRLDASGGRSRNGVPLRFTLLYAADNPALATLAEAIQAAWRPLGVQAQPRAVPRDRLLPDHLALRAFEAVLIGWRGVANDPDVYQLWHSTQATGGTNFSGFRNDRVDRALEQARQSLKQRERAERYAEFQEVFADEVPGLPLYYPRFTYAVSARVGGVTLPPALFDPSSRFHAMAGWYIDPQYNIGTK
jgi:peptide/nickel transport system substrate-binding protein